MKTSTLLAIFVVIAVVVAFFIFSKPSYPMTEEDAKNFFLEDLEEKYPTADVREIVEIIPMQGDDGTPYFQLKARVTKGLHTPCPERLHLYYDYPPKNYVAQPPEFITGGCIICKGELGCIIAFPEEAVIASHTYDGTEEIAEFVRQNANARADAAFIGEYKNETGVWKVKWSIPEDVATYSVYLSKSKNKIVEIVKEV